MKHNGMREGSPKMNDDDRCAEILKQLQCQYPGVVAITPAAALTAAGVPPSKNPANQANQALARGAFPFPVVKMGNRNRVLLMDMARVLAGATVRPAKEGTDRNEPRGILASTPNETHEAHA
jgi:hypothetical protein